MFIDASSISSPDEGGLLLQMASKLHGGLQLLVPLILKRIHGAVCRKVLIGWLILMDMVCLPDVAVMLDLYTIPKFITCLVGTHNGILPHLHHAGRDKINNSSML
jgi:hypothetical protein